MTKAHVRVRSMRGTTYAKKDKTSPSERLTPSKGIVEKKSNASDTEARNYV